MYITRESKISKWKTSLSGNLVNLVQYKHLGKKNIHLKTNHYSSFYLVTFGNIYQNLW